MMTDEQRAALRDHDLTLLQTLMGDEHGRHLLARNAVGELKVIDVDGGLHPYEPPVGTVRLSPAEAAAKHPAAAADLDATG